MANGVRTLGPSDPRCLAATPQVAGARGSHYFSRPWLARTILASFFVVTIPLWWIGASVDPETGWSIGVVFFAVFGMSHFLVTFAIYLQAANRRHFASSLRSRLLYFGTPLTLLVGFDLYRALGLGLRWPVLETVLGLAIRTADFQHSARQGFGVLQLFRGQQTGYWRQQRFWENNYFTLMSVLMLITACAGGEFSSLPISVVVAGLAAATGAVALTGHLRALTGSKGRATAAAYFAVQSTCMWLSAWRTELYGLTLAMHYVEYHLLMAPRCLQAPLDPDALPDRWYGRLRSLPWLHYGLLIGAALVITHITWLGMGRAMSAEIQQGTLSYRLAVSVFDGLFVTHYVLDAFIWRFRDPYYRSALGALYFAPVAIHPAPAESPAGDASAKEHAEPQ